MEYPLEEKIGKPHLLVGREKEFAKFDKWINLIPEKLGKSRVILARRKSGKTSFIQRLFNRLWSENGRVIPFFFDIAEKKFWLPDFVELYFRAFASQYISFLERDPTLVRRLLSMEAIGRYGKTHENEPLLWCVDSLMENKKSGNHAAMWDTAFSAPHRIAADLDIRFLVMIDEFQNISSYIYPDKEYQTQPEESMAGCFHSLSESKVAPMLVTGSYVQWLIQLMDKYLEAGRLSRIRLNPYLTPDEGLLAVYKYAEAYKVPVTNETALQINELCFSDPFFISCVFQSPYEERDLTTEEGVAEAVNYEISDRDSEMSMTWREYIDFTLDRINDRNAKQILLHLSKYNNREWTAAELKETLKMDIEVNDIYRKLITLAKADLIEQGEADIDFHGIKDGTLYLILRSRFEKEISSHKPNLKKEFLEEIQELKKKNRSLQGKLNHLTGLFAEIQLAGSFRTKKRFSPGDYFEGAADNTPLNITSVRTRVIIKREDDKNLELDVLAESDEGTFLVVEVKKRQVKTGTNIIEDFSEKLELLGRLHPAKKIIPAFLSLGGFTDEAMGECNSRGIATAEGIAFY